MREAYWGYWLILLGIFVIVIMMLVSNLTTTNTQDYYLIKEVTEASMVDAVDLAYYRQSGELKINREKFVESFLRRFAENVALSTYKVDFYGIYEAPPKVSVRVTSQTSTYTVAADPTSFDIINEIDAILELDSVITSSATQDNDMGQPANPGNGNSSGNNNNNNNNNNNGNNSGGGSSTGNSDLEEGEYPLGTATADDLRNVFNNHIDDFYYFDRTEGNTEYFVLADYDMFVDLMIEYYALDFDYEVDDFLSGDVEELCGEIYDTFSQTRAEQIEE